MDAKIFVDQPRGLIAFVIAAGAATCPKPLEDCNTCKEAPYRGPKGVEYGRCSGA